ncbi:MAG: hybrid sensor histidine kinase/response regulator [Limnochordia bacterium]
MPNHSLEKQAVSSAHILIGSTDSTVLRDLSLLDPEQFKLIPVQSFHEALHCVETRSIEVIVLDMDSLGEDGFLAAMIIHHRHETRHIPMIVLSSHDQLPIHAIDGCSDFIDCLTKPYDPDVLVWKIKSFWRMRTYLQQIKSFPDSLGSGAYCTASCDDGQDLTDDHIESFINFNSSILSNQLAACIAHEIKNPITTMQALLELAKMSEKPLQPDKVEVLLGELQQLSTVVSNFMTLSKNQRSGREKHHLEQIVQSMKPVLESKGALEEKTIVYELNPCPPIMVNYHDIVQLILNLAINGLEAMTDKDAKLTITAEHQNGRVLLHVADEGPGIPDAVIEKIWEPFYTTKSTGSGLGLVICRALAERNNAEINVRSSRAGSVFTVAFRPQED